MRDSSCITSFDVQINKVTRFRTCRLPLLAPWLLVTSHMTTSTRPSSASTRARRAGTCCLRRPRSAKLLLLHGCMHCIMVVIFQQQKDINERSVHCRLPLLAPWLLVTSHTTTSTRPSLASTRARRAGTCCLRRPRSAKLLLLHGCMHCIMVVIFQQQKDINERSVHCRLPLLAPWLLVTSHTTTSTRPSSASTRARRAGTCCLRRPR